MASTTESRSSSAMKVSVTDGMPMLWNMADVKLLRQHRVAGVMDGPLPEQPHQNKTRGLPMVLMKEAATLLQEIGVIQLVEYPDLRCSPTKRMQLLQEALEMGDFAKQRNRYFEERKAQMSQHSEKILLSAKKKNAKLAKNDPKHIPESELTLDKVLSDKIKNLPTPKHGSMLVQIHMEYPFINDLPSKPYEWNYPSNEREEMSYAVYKDLWTRGYWVFSGEDCSLDFLCYKGDPILVHACMGVTVVAREDPDHDGMTTTSAINTSIITTAVNKSIATVALNSSTNTSAVNSINNTATNSTVSAIDANSNSTTTAANSIVMAVNSAATAVNSAATAVNSITTAVNSTTTVANSSITVTNCTATVKNSTTTAANSTSTSTTVTSPTTVTAANSSSTATAAYSSSTATAADSTNTATGAHSTSTSTATDDISTPGAPAGWSKPSKEKPGLWVPKMVAITRLNNNASRNTVFAFVTSSRVINYITIQYGSDYGGVHL